MNTDNRRADVATFCTDTPSRMVKAWLSHDRERKTYRLTVVPVEVKVCGDGVVMHTTMAYSGYNVHVADAPRYSRRTLDALAASFEVMERTRVLAFNISRRDVPTYYDPGAAV